MIIDEQARAASALPGFNIAPPIADDDRSPQIDVQFARRAHRGVDGNGGLALTLADLTEPSEGEYARILVEPGDWTLVDNLLTAAEVNFVASGLAWGIIYGWFVCDCATGTAGKLIAIEQFLDAPYNVGAAGEVKVVARLRACSGLPPLA